MGFIIIDLLHPLTLFFLDFGPGTWTRNLNFADFDFIKIMIFHLLIVVLITGGYDKVRSAEIFNPDTKTSCSLPQLPEVRYQHSEDGGLACGGDAGDATRSSCVKWSPASGAWTKSHTLREKRALHVSWATASGVYLIGGKYSQRTSEKMKMDGSVEEGFSLKYDTRLHSAFHYQLVTNI